MTKDQIQARIKELETNRESAKSNFIAIEGAIQDCNHWLDTLEKNKPSENTKAKKD